MWRHRLRSSRAVMAVWSLLRSWCRRIVRPTRRAFHGIFYELKTQNDDSRMTAIGYKRLFVALGVYQCGVFLATCYLLTWLLWNTGHVMQVQQSMVDVYSIGHEKMRDALSYMKYVTYGETCGNGTICNCSNFQQLWENPRALLAALDIPPSPRLVNQQVDIVLEDFRTEAEMEPKFFEYMSLLNAQCDTTANIGMDAKTWTVCADDLYRPRNPCVVYTFGINNAMDFESDMAVLYTCEVHTFDPEGEVGLKDVVRGLAVHRYGMDSRDGTVPDKGWQMKSLMSIRKELGHTERTIAVLKIDADPYEWTVLDSILDSDELRTVKQLLLVLHMPANQDRAAMLKTYSLFRRLERFGFKKYAVRQDSRCSYQSQWTQRQLSSCLKLSFINIRYM